VPSCHAAVRANTIITREPGQGPSGGTARRPAVCTWIQARILPIPGLADLAERSCVSLRDRVSWLRALPARVAACARAWTMLLLNPDKRHAGSTGQPEPCITP